AAGAAPARPPRRIELPVYASYESYMPDLPETVWKWLVQEVHWPTLTRADDDGDGRRDLFALSRYGVWIYHAGVGGLPSTPSRKLEIVPFDEKAERRFETSVHNYFARDLDGDLRADLVINLIQGGLTDGRSTTRIHLNRGSGASLSGPPDVVLETHGGIAGVDFVDLEGDGHLELLETNFEFGVLQLVRLLVSRRAETTVRILALDPKSPGGVRTLWENELALALDFKESRFAGILPAMGDWNGDGLLDLFVSRGDQAIGFRLGSRAAGAPRFGPVLEQQAVPLSAGASRIADLDGDGLDEIVVFTSTDPAPPLIVLENLGRLPGSPSSLRPR
ncbi:VCBS repeat-containing protein, partial [Myxococcota bacterium]|nr:VCBS repeat-containing protein [Myxococcota bacterium]